MQIKKKQHYVWKEYLKNWSNNNHINSLLLTKNKYLKINLINTSQENYFYSLPDFSHNEFLEIVDIVNDHSSENLRPEIFKIVSAIYENSNFKNSEPEMQHIFKTNKVNMMEDFFTITESLGKKFLNVKSSKQLKGLIKDDNDYNNFLTFISFQYVRTKKMKESILFGIRKKNYYKEKYWIIFQIIYGFEIAMGLSVRKKIKINILVNNSDLNFITCDNPIFNLLQNDIDDNGYVKSLELYYPLNPKTAIFISSSDKNEIIETKISEEETQNLNKCVYSNALENIYYLEANDLQL